MTDVQPVPPTRWRWLITATLASAAIYGAIAALGPQYTLDIPVIERPILLVLGLYLLAFAPYGLTLWLAKTTPDTKRVFWWVVISSAAFRVLLLPTPPFQEIDIYRYLWDGIVITQGESPYRYPPQEVVEALNSFKPMADDRLEKLASVAREHPPFEDVVREIHYGQYPSPYPPVSQAVFAAAAWTTPSSWSAEGRLTMLKVWLTAFDLATLLIVLRLLRLAGLPIAFAIAYGWCPLMLKEVAGSGHLDSIATFFLTAGIWATAEALSRTAVRRSWFALLSATLIGLGIGAKLFPVIITPLLVLTWWRQLGWKPALIGIALLSIVTAGTMAPMLLRESGQQAKTTPMLANAAAKGEATIELAPPPTNGNAVTTEPSSVASPSGLQPTADPTAGLAVFLKQWEMNDFLFMVLLENFRSQADLAVDDRPWFAVVPDSFASGVSDQGQSLLTQLGMPAVDTRQAAFLLTRFVTASVFIVIALTLAIKSSGPSSTLTSWLNAAFLTVAWFWLLAPTQNPWYWCWALPLLPFARNRAWYGLAALSFAYYLRFWLSYHFAEVKVAGTPYEGGNFFHYVVVWLEFGPWLLWLLLEWLASKNTVWRFTEHRSATPDNQIDN